MAENTLLVEGLPVDLDDQIKSKLSLYFKNKRRSGGEISELRADPSDTRRVLLVYSDDKVRNKVVSRKTHQVDLRGSLGVVTLHVVLPPEDVKAQTVVSSQEEEQATLLRVTSERDREFLELFFEQCITDPVLKKHGKNTWLLQMPNKSVMDGVYAREPQKHGIFLEVYEEKEEEDMVDKRRYVLSGLDDGCFADSISLYIHSCSHRAEHTWKAVGGDSIMVTFKEDIDGHKFMEKTSFKKLNNKKIEACRLELTKSVIIEGDMSGIPEEYLSLYFSNKNRSGGDNIKSIIGGYQNQSIVITFEDWRVAQRVAEAKHTLMGKKCVAQLFHPDLQRVLTEQTHFHPSNFSTDIAIPVPSELLSSTTLRKELTVALQKVHTMVSFNIISEQPQLELKMSIDKQLLGLLRHGPSWETNARREVQTHLEMYMVEHIPMEAEVWQAVKGSCAEVKEDTALISFKICSSELVVVGKREEVKTLVKIIKIKVEKARDELHILKNTVEKEIQFDSKERLCLIFDLVKDELEDVDLSENDANCTIHLKGLRERVQTAETVIQKVQDTLTSKRLFMSHKLAQFAQKFLNDCFSQDNIVAVVICSKETVTVLAKKGDIDRAEKTLQEVFKQESILISAEYDTDTFSKQWETINADLKKELEATQNCQNIAIEFSGDKIELYGFRSVVDDVLAKVKGRLENKKVVTKDVPLKNLQEVEFACVKLSADSQLRALGATILPCRSPQYPCLKVTATSDRIAEAIDVVNRHINTIITTKYMYSKAGEAKILKKSESVLKMQAKGLGCNLELSEQISSQQFNLGYHLADPNTTKTPFIPPPSASQTAAIPHVQVPNTIVIGRVSVILKKADITKEAVDVIVNSSNQNLDLDTGVSGAIIIAAGQSVVDECKKHGPQEVGKVVLTSGGNLNCKHIAHIAGLPVSILTVLQHCESKQAATVSIPTIGTGRGGSDPKDSAKAILQGVKNHVSSTHPSSLKKIFVVAFEDRTYDTMKEYFNQPRRSKTHRGGAQMMAVPVTSLGLPLNQVKIKDILIELKKGNITTENVKAIVNSTNEDVNLKHGVSGAIFNAAGSAVEAECATIRPLRANDAGVTSGGGLQCDYIIHIVGPASVGQATQRVKSVLKHCEDKKIPTVSFPAIGTGGGGLKFIDSVTAMLVGIHDHLSTHNASVLKQIFLVVDQVKAMSECQKGLLVWTQLKQDMADDDSSDASSCEEDNSGGSSCEEDNSGATAGEVLMGPVKVKVFSGDITKEKTEAIVNSTNTTLNLPSGVSGAILKAAGQAVVDECTTLGTQPADGVVITKAGNLAAKHIIHMVGPTKEQDITSSMLKVFKLCEDNKILSVAFPAIGTGAGKLSAVDAGNAMVNAIEKHIKTTLNTSLKNVHIVIFQTNMIQDFLKRLNVPTQAKRPASQKAAVPPPQQPSLCLASACRDVTFPKVEVEVLGCCSSDMEKVKKLVDELVTEDWKLYPICSPHLPLLHDLEKQNIVALSRSLQVCVSISSPDTAIASGKAEDALTLVRQMENYLQKAKEYVSRQDEEKRLRETVQWEVSDGETWAELDQAVSLDLEQAAHKKQSSISYTRQRQTYTVNLDNMVRTDKNGTTAKIKRTLKADSETTVIEPPRNWDKMENKMMDVVDLSPTSKEYQTIQTNFLKTSKNPSDQIHPTYTVVKIQRIQNQEQWQKYAVKKQMLDKKYPKTKNEINLYHGSTAQICQKVNNYGFNRSFCGRNATVYGNGTYFGKESWYSCADQYSNPDAQGVKYMYQARVLVGKPCLGIKDMIEPTPLDPSNPHDGLHDCAVNNLQSPFIYVVFSDAGAYPEYLISFKAS